MSCLNSIVPQLLGKFLPLEIYEKEKSDMFEMIIEILKSRKFIDSDSTSQLLVKSLLSFTASEENIAQVLEWFSKDQIFDVKLTTSHKHSMVRCIFTSRLITEDIKA